jgi:uncharacterized membrane protein
MYGISRMALAVLALAWLAGASPANAGYTFTSIDYPGATSTSAYGINDAGQIVGSYFSGSTGKSFLLTSTGFSSFSYPGASQTTAYGINDAGQIVGNYQLSSGPPLDPHPIHRAFSRPARPTVPLPTPARLSPFLMASTTPARLSAPIQTVHTKHTAFS